MPLSYILYTEHIWEDFFITFKFSRNLCEGNGLVYWPGKKVHGFTSPLGTLLPAFCYFITGCKSYVPAIWMFRILFCIPAFAAGGIFLMKTVRENLPNYKYAPVFAGLLYLCEGKSIIFSMNGMETALMLFFMSWSFYLLQKGEKCKWLPLGISWAGLMWIRPDSFIYIGLFIISFTIFRFASLKQVLILFLKAGLATTVLYLPWFLWAWIYYGSPIPHTVMAKSVLFSHVPAYQIVKRAIFDLPVCVQWVFSPVYPQFEEWPPTIKYFSGVIGLFCFFYWMIPFNKDRTGRMASFIFFVLCIYMSLMTFPYPWYFPSVAFLGLATLSIGIYRICEKSGLPANTGNIPGYILLIIVVSIFVTFSLDTYRMKIQQETVEGQRTAIGKWLKMNTGKNETVYIECLGYVGYFSEREMFDYPGLASPEVVRMIKHENLNFQSIIPQLKPDWIVMRPSEYLPLINNADFKRHYEAVKIFDVSEKIKSYRYLPGGEYLIHDACFYVFRKKNE